VTSKPDFKVMVLSLVFMQLTRDLFAIAKFLFYKAFNSIFGKIGCNATEAVLFALVKSKCMPILLYGLKLAK